MKFAIRCSATLLGLFGVGCGDEVVVNPPPGNSPPRILLSGPELDAVNPIRGPLPTLWVIPSDPDGADDIAAVVLKVGTVTLNSMIVRPDSAEARCVWVHYAPMDTIDVLPFMTKRTFEVLLPLRNDAGVYGSGLYYWTLTEGGLMAHSPVFGPYVKDCYSGVDYQYYLERGGLYPPAIAVPRDVHITYASLSLADISITVYDQSGATATATYPNVTVIFSNYKEDQVLP